MILNVKLLTREQKLKISSTTKDAKLAEELTVMYTKREEKTGMCFSSVAFSCSIFLCFTISYCSILSDHTLM